MENHLTPRQCLLTPIPEHRVAADLLSSAANAILAGDLARADDLARQADMPILFEFGRRLMGKEDPAIHRRRPVPPFVGKLEKVISRMPGSAETRALFERDGWRCRFCGCRVMSPRARSIMRTCLPGAVPWSEAEGFHGGFYALSASVDHVLPHSAGGANDLPNLVTACWSCQFGRGAWTIEEVGLEDPRARTPVVDDWDGLSRLLGRGALGIVAEAGVDNEVALEEPRTSIATAALTRVLSSDQARWLATLDRIQLPPSRRIMDFLDGCADLDVSWSIGKVLLARMRVGQATVEFMAIEPTGEVHLPWLVGGHKDAYRKFADVLVVGLPGAICYETPKLWNISMPGKRRITLVELLGALSSLRSALEVLRAELHRGRDE